MKTFGQYFFEALVDLSIFKDKRGNVVRRGDIVYILPDAYERSQGINISSARKVPHFKHPYGQISAVSNDGKSMMVQTVRLIDNRIIPYEKFRGMSGGKIGIFKRDDLVKLDLAETRDVSTIKLPI